MRAYWDTSALVQAHLDLQLHGRLLREGGLTRPHSLSETFATLTGNRAFQLSANQAARSLIHLANYLEFVELPADTILSALQKAQSLGVRGGRVHDYLHALAADQSGADKLLTLDKNDFAGLVQKVIVEQL